MLKNARGKRRLRLHKALLISTSLAMMLAAAAPALTQESNTATEVSQRPEVTPYQHDTPAITNEVPGEDPARGGVASDASHVGQEGTVYEGTTPVPDNQSGEIEGDPLNVTGQDALFQDRQPDPGPGQPPGDTTENQRDVALMAARDARQAAQEAQQASDTAAQLATQGVQQSAANLEEAQAAQEAAQEAQQASDTAQGAAQAAQLAAAREDAQAAQEAAQEAQQASGAAESAAQAVQQAVERATGTDVKDAFSRALQAARSAEAGGNTAFAAEGDPGKAGADPKKASDGRAAGEVAIGEAARGDAVGDKGIAGKDAADGAGLKEDANEVGSNAAAISAPAKGSIPMLFLGGGSLLAAGIFVVLKVFRSWFRPSSVPGVWIIRSSGFASFKGGSDEGDQDDLGSYRRREEKERRFTAPGV